MKLFHRKILQDYLKPDETGRTRLHWAARNGHLDLVIAALEASGEKLTLNHFLIKDNDGWTPLHWAAQGGHLDQVMAALQASGEKLTLAHFLIKDNDGWTPLHAAARHGHLDQVMAALEASGEKLTPDHFLIKDNGGWTPLHWAAEKGHLDQVFLPSHWTGRLLEMMRLWDQVPPERKEDFDFKQRRDEVIDLSVHSAPRLDLQAISQASRTAGSFPTDGQHWVPPVAVQQK